MNIIAIQLVLGGTKPGLVVMCKLLTVDVEFLFMHASLFYFHWPQLATARLDETFKVLVLLLHKL